MTLSSLDLDDLLDGVHERFLTVDPFTTARVIKGEPESIQNPPVIYSMLERMTPTEHANVMAFNIRFMCRVCIALQDRLASESSVRRLTVELTEAIESDDRLGNRISSGRAMVVEVLSGFARISNTTFRVIDLYVEIIYKRPRLESPRVT